MPGQAEDAEPVDLYEYDSQYSTPDNARWRPINFLSESIHSIRLVTWNIWFHRFQQERRFKSVVQELKSLPSVDIIALQEVTKSFLSLLRADKEIQSRWVITECWDDHYQRELQSNIWYRNMFLVRKSWSGFTKASVKRLHSPMGRFIVTLEISPPDGSVVARPNISMD